MNAHDFISLKKIILASISWIALYPKQLLYVSVVPIILILPFVVQLQKMLVDSTALTILPKTPITFLFYLILAILSYTLLAVNVYRLVLLGTSNVGKFGLSFNKRFGQFFGTFILIQLLLNLPVILTKQPIFIMIVYALIAPMVLNLPRLAIDKAKTYYRLNFITRIKLTVLQISIPGILLIIVGLIIPQSQISVLLVLVLKFLLNYWELITLALCYQQIDKAQQLEGDVI